MLSATLYFIKSHFFSRLYPGLPVGFHRYESTKLDMVAIESATSARASIMRNFG